MAMKIPEPTRQSDANPAIASSDIQQDAMKMECIKSIFASQPPLWERSRKHATNGIIMAKNSTKAKLMR